MGFLGDGPKVSLPTQASTLFPSGVVPGFARWSEVSLDSSSARSTFPFPRVRREPHRAIPRVEAVSQVSREPFARPTYSPLLPVPRQLQLRSELQNARTPHDSD